VNRHYRSNYSHPFRINVTPKEAEWRYLSFRVLALEPGQTQRFNTEESEFVVVPLSGEGFCAFGEEEFSFSRRSVFEELTDIYYLPPRSNFSLRAAKSIEVAIGGAPAEGKLPARRISKDEIKTSVRGDANVKRGVSALADSDELTERLTVYEIHTPSGNWSSFPPHRHDTRDNSSYHEETYYYRLRPENGFAIQRIYTRDTDLDVAIPVQNGDLVLIHEGYHPVVKAPGTNAYYLNFLAGDVRKITAINDPEYDWVSQNWAGNPITVPMKG
jgi:5-deoxy-glucuronate isomerase